MTKLLILLFAGISSGAIYAMFALCLCCLFRVSSVLNLAVGDFAMLGVFGVNFAHLHGFDFAESIVLVLLAVAALCFLFDSAVLRVAAQRQSHRDALLTTLFLTYGLSFLLEGGAQHLFGAGLEFGPTLWGGPALRVAGIPIQRAAVLLLGVATFTGLGFASFLHFTLSGKAMSACGENEVGARVVGIRAVAYRRGIFMGMGMLAAIFGIVEVPLSGFSITSGFMLGLTGILAAVLAGFTHPLRAVAAGLSVGIAEALIGGYISTAYNEVLLYTFLVVLVLAFPNLIGTSAAEDGASGTLSAQG